MESLVRDLKFSLKLLLKDKAFNAITILTLALCIGANSAIFTVLHSVVLRPLPFADSGRLVMIYNRYPGVGVNKGSNGIPDYLDRKKETAVFEEIALIEFPGYDVGMEGSPERVPGQRVTPSYFRMLRTSPALGRVFTEQEATQGNDKVAILSHSLWQRLYGAAPDAIGKDIRLSGVPYRIVGVMPEGFQFLAKTTSVWVPFAFTPEQTSDERRHSNSWTMAARLRPGVTLATAQQRIDAINAVNLDRFPQFRQILINARFNTKVAFLLDELTEDTRPMLYLLQGAVAFVLLIGCVNVANLMLVRANVRMKEFAIRFSLGAGRGRLTRQLMTESVVLSLAGGSLGLLIGYWGVRLLRILGADDLPRAAEIRMDTPVLLFNLVLAVATGLVFGLAPVLHLMRRNLLDIFRASERGATVVKRAVTARGALVVSQVALAFVLLIGAGLMTISFLRAIRVDPGFRAGNVATARLSLPRSRYANDAGRRAFMEKLVTESRALPGVAAAGITTYLPFSGNNNSSVIEIMGYPLGSGEAPPVPGWNIVGGEYFRAMGIPLLQGRAFLDSDTADSEVVCIIDQFLARKYWPNGNPIGAKIRKGIAIGNDKPPVATVVGVVGSVKTADVTDRNAVGQIYFPYKQMSPGSAHVVVKGERDAGPLIAGLRGRVARLDSELPLFDVKSMEQRLAESMLSRRAPMVLCLVFAALALLLAAIGLYGVLAYAVTQRTRELGIRMALGAQAPDVLRMVMGQGLRLAAAGLLTGAVAAFALTRTISSLLYEVKPSDPVVFLIVGAVLGGAALAAAAAPSWRATRIDPLDALRQE